MNAIVDRRSIRKFQDKPVEKNIIEEILKAALASPSAKNDQPWRYGVYTGEAKAKLLDAMEQGLRREEEKPIFPATRGGVASALHTLRIMRQAPVTIMVLNTQGGNPMDSIQGLPHFGEMMDLISIGASVENMLLRAQELGVGTLWIGNTLFAYPELVSAMGTDHQLVCAVSLGYADETPDPRPRKKWDEVVTFVE